MGQFTVGVHCGGVDSDSVFVLCLWAEYQEEREVYCGGNVSCVNVKWNISTVLYIMVSLIFGYPYRMINGYMENRYLYI